MRIFIGVLLAVSLVGCKGGPAISVKKAAPLLPSGFTKGESDDKVASLGVPPGWRQGVDRMMTMGSALADVGASAGGDSAQPMPEDLSKSLDDMTKQGEAEADAKEKESLEKLKAKGIIINCINSSKPTPGEERTHFYLLKQSQGGNWTWEDAEKSEVGQYKTKPKATKVTLPIGEALRMQDSWQLIDGMNYTMISYVVPNGPDLYTLRFITEESPETVTSIAQQVAESLRIN